MWHETLDKLKHFTDTVEFERLCIDLLNHSGFGNIAPRGPGLPDFGVDAENCLYPDEEVFQFSIQKDWERKVYETLKKLHLNKILSHNALVVFIFNDKVSPKKLNTVRKKTRDLYSYRIQILDREWIRSQLDRHQHIREKYLGIKAANQYHTTKPEFSFMGILQSFSLADYSRQLLSLYVQKNKPWKRFLMAYYREMLLPYVEKPTLKMQYKLFPIPHNIPNDLDEEIDNTQLPDGLHDKLVILLDGTPISVYKPYEDTEPIPGEPDYYFTKSKKLIKGKYTVQWKLSEVQTLLTYIYFQLNRHGYGLYKNRKVNYTTITKGLNKFLSILCEQTAEYIVIEVIKTKNAETFCKIMESIYYGFARTYLPSTFLLYFSEKILKLKQQFRNLIKAGDDIALTNMVSLLHDDRVPNELFIFARDAANKIGMAEEWADAPIPFYSLEMLKSRNSKYDRVDLRDWHK